MTTARFRFLGGFGDCQVEVHCDSEALASELRLRWHHLLRSPSVAGGRVLRLELNETASGCELRDSTGHYHAAGPVEYVFRHGRKWLTSLFAATRPDLLWVHAAAATLNDAAVLLTGPAGAGKSTLAVRLLERSWRLIGDDVVGVRPGRWEALPLPFSPEVRSGNEPCAFLEQPKDVVEVLPGRVSSHPAPVAAIVFPEYVSARFNSVELAPMSVVSATQALVAQCAIDDRARALRDVFRFSQAVPSYRLRYRDSIAAAAEIASMVAMTQPAHLSTRQGLAGKAR